MAKRISNREPKAVIPMEQWLQMQQIEERRIAYMQQQETEIDRLVGELNIARADLLVYMAQVKTLETKVLELTNELETANKVAELLANSAITLMTDEPNPDKRKVKRKERRRLEQEANEGYRVKQRT